MKDIPDILDGMKRSPNVLTNFVRGIPKDRLHLRRGEGFWTIAEHVHHLGHLNPTLIKRVQNFLTQDKPQFVPYALAKYDDAEPVIDVEAALADFATGRKALLDILGKAGPDIWKKETSHPQFEQFSFLFMVRHILAHDYWHMYRMEALWQTKDEFLKPA